MAKQEFIVEYSPSKNISPQEAEFKLFKALEILLNINNVYEPEDKKSVYNA